MREETRTVLVFDSVEEYVEYLKSIGKCFLCWGTWPHDERGCPTAFMEAE